MGGHGEHEGGHGAEHHEEAPLWERLLGTGNALMHGLGEKVIEPGLQTLEHGGGAVGSVAGGVAKALPFLGTAIGVGQFGYHAHEAANTEDNGNYTNNEHWNHVGEATLGAAGAAASWCPPAAMYLGAGELATNAIGGASGMLGDGINSVFGTHLDMGFNAGSVVGGVEHLASNLSMKEHPILGGAVSALCPALGLAANMGDIVTGSGQAIDAIGGGISSAAHGAWDMAGNIGNGAMNMASGAKDMAGDAWSAASDW